MTLYTDLDLPPDASPEAIKQAYRQKAKAAHPDGGGSEEAFHMIHRAYLVLSDPAKRQRYDETGTFDENINSEATRLLSAFSELLDGILKSISDPSSVDVIRLMKDAIKGKIAAVKQARITLVDNNKKLTALALRFKCKTEQNLFVKIIEEQIRKATQQIAVFDKDIEFEERVLEMLSAYSYEFDTPRPPQFYDQPTQGLGGFWSGFRT